MVLTDSFKVFAHNGNQVWRVLAYVLVCILILSAITLACCYGLVSTLNESGFFNQIFDIVNNNIFNLKLVDSLDGVNTLFESFTSLISSNIGQLLPLTVILIAIWGIGGSFLFGLADVALCDCVYGYMSSNSKISFFNCFISNISKSVKLQLNKLYISLPLDLLIVAAILGSLFIYNTSNLIILALAPFIIVLLVVLLLTLKQSLFCLWTPSMVVSNLGVFGGLRYGFITAIHNFKYLFARQLVMTLIYVGINVAAWILTAGVGLILTIPATVLLNQTFSNVAYFHFNGLRFYTDENTIVTPKNRGEYENIIILKNLI